MQEDREQFLDVGICVFGDDDRIYAENLLGIRYRYKNRKGEWVGGAMVYIERGLGCKWLAVLFAVFCIFASFGMGI